MVVAPPCDTTLLTGPKDFLPFFAGQNVRRPGSVSVYAVVTEYHDSCNIVDVRYYTFNPYNYGKEICVGFGLGPFCFGRNVTLGNHVGDWERLEMRFQNNMPTDLGPDSLEKFLL